MHFFTCGTYKPSSIFCEFKALELLTLWLNAKLTYKYDYLKVDDGAEIYQMMRLEPFTFTE